MEILQKLIAAILALFGLIPAVPAQTQTDVPANVTSAEITVMSYNVYVVDALQNKHSLRAPGVIANIRSVMPDVFGLQEADLDWVTRISAAMPEYSFVGRGRDENETDGEYSPLFYRADKYELVKGGTFWFSDTPSAPSRTWGSMYNRICSWAVLREKSGGFTFAVFNSHWDHLSIESRNRSAALLLQKTAEYAPGMPTVITGDFNCKANTVAYKTLIDGGFIDAMYVSPVTSDTGSFHGYYKLSTENELPIDHILFLRDHGAAAEYRVLTDKYDGRYPSDHFPIAAILTLF